MERWTSEVSTRTSWEYGPRTDQTSVHLRRQEIISAGTLETLVLLPVSELIPERFQNFDPTSPSFFLGGPHQDSPKFGVDDIGLRCMSFDSTGSDSVVEGKPVETGQIVVGVRTG